MHSCIYLMVLILIGVEVPDEKIDKCLITEFGEGLREVYEIKT